MVPLSGPQGNMISLSYIIGGVEGHSGPVGIQLLMAG